MSVNLDASPPSLEQQTMEIMRNIFAFDYALEEDDRDLINRLIQWGHLKEGLSEAEVRLLKERGFMDNDDTFMVPNEFWFGGIVMPSYWLKCIMGFNDMLTFTKEEEAKIK